MFSEFAYDASAHHERLDGSGYYRGLKGTDLSTHVRILAAADVFDALSAEHPYRAALPIDQVLSMLGGLTSLVFSLGVFGLWSSVGHHRLSALCDGDRLSPAMLIVLGGLPGVGKTTIARELARLLKGVHIRIDSIELAIRESGVTVVSVDDAGYRVGYAVAEDNLRLGHIVIADSVSLSEIL